MLLRKARLQSGVIAWMAPNRADHRMHRIAHCALRSAVASQSSRIPSHTDRSSHLADCLRQIDSGADNDDPDAMLVRYGRAAKFIAETMVSVEAGRGPARSKAAVDAAIGRLDRMLRLRYAEGRWLQAKAFIARRPHRDQVL